MKPTRNFFYISLVAVFLIVSSLFGFKYYHFLNTPLVAVNQQPATVLFSHGSSVKKVAYSLKQQNLLDHPMFFVLFARFSGVEHDLKAGEYILEPGITPRVLIQKMKKGEAVRHVFTIVEGWTFAQMVAALNSNQYIKHTIQDLSPAEIMEKIGHAGEIPEGRFAPDTYLCSGDLSDIKILLNAYQLMQKRLQLAWQNRGGNVSYHCPYEALTVASIIEKETAVAKEKPLIAGVILRRLEKGMLLQVDPTVIYGLGTKFTGKLNKSDLLIDTPYNTYTRKGLPPTPIAMPSVDSIEAALHPIIGEYWYYVSKGDGSHKFSDTLKDQTKAVNKYLKK